MRQSVRQRLSVLLCKYSKQKSISNQFAYVTSKSASKEVSKFINGASDHKSHWVLMQHAMIMITSSKHSYIPVSSHHPHSLPRQAVHSHSYRAHRCWFPARDHITPHFTGTQTHFPRIIYEITCSAVRLQHMLHLLLLTAAAMKDEKIILAVAAQSSIN